MTAPPGLARAATRLLLAGAVILILVLAATRTGVRWDPFGLERRRLEAAVARAERAEAEAAARAAEVVAARAQTARIEHHLKTTAGAERATEVVRIQAGDADDAVVPLHPDRADRLRAHDRELCRLAPDLAGCPAQAGAAGNRETALRPGGPAA